MLWLGVLLWAGSGLAQEEAAMEAGAMAGG